MKLQEATTKGYTRTGRENELVSEALREHWSKVGPELLEALIIICEYEDIKQYVGSIIYGGCQKVITDAEEVDGI